MTTDLHKDHERWLAELVLELRLLDVDGRRIGDAVATAREFLADAGVPAEEAFGTPREYAVSLGLEPAPEDRTALTATVVHAAVGVLGFLAFAWAGGDAWRGDRFTVDAGIVALVVLVLALVLLTPRLLPFVLRAAPWKIGAGAVVLLGVQVAVVFALGSRELGSVPAWPVAALGLVVMVVELVRALLDRSADDPVVDPLGGADVGRSGRIATALPPLVSLVAAWCFVLLDVLTGG